MTRKTKKEFLNDFTRYPELARKVLNQMGNSWAEIIEYPHDYRDASAGVSGFIYYSETHRFAKRNIGLILEAIGDFQDETGCSFDGEKLTDLNWLAWFALESVMQEVIDYKEDE